MWSILQGNHCRSECLKLQRPVLTALLGRACSYRRQGSLAGSFLGRCTGGSVEIKIKILEEEKDIRVSGKAQWYGWAAAPQTDCCTLRVTARHVCDTGSSFCTSNIQLQPDFWTSENFRQRTTFKLLWTKIKCSKCGHIQGTQILKNQLLHTRTLQHMSLTVWKTTII